MPLATRSRGPRLVLLLLGSVLLAGSAVAAPIIVEYEITGGQAGGSGFNSVPFLDHAQVSSGHVIVSLDCGASSCSASPTVSGPVHVSWSLQLTNGAVHRNALPFNPLGAFVSYHGARGPGKSMRVGIQGSFHFFNFYSFPRFQLRADSQGVITHASYANDYRITAYTPYGGTSTPNGGTYWKTATPSFTGLVGQEVASSVPEPGPVPALAAGLLALTAWLGLLLARRARS